MVRLAAVFLVLLGVLLGGCAPRERAARASSRSDVDRLPDVEALRRERAAFFGEEGTVGATAPTPPPKRRPKLPRAGAVPTPRVARIDALAFNGHFGKGPVCSPTEEPLAKDGRLCGDVRLPVATLTEEEARRVVDLLEAAEATYAPRDGNAPSRAVVRCDFDPHHAFLLYDAAGAVVGTISICMTCHEWLVRPPTRGTGDGEPVLLDAPELSAFRSIFDAHALGGWIFDEDDPRAAELVRARTTMER